MNSKKSSANCKSSFSKSRFNLSFRFSIPNSIGQEIEKVCRGIYPLQNVMIRKVKVIKKPKFDGKKTTNKLSFLF